MDQENREKKRLVTFSGLARALANDYDSIYVIARENDSYQEFRKDKKSGELELCSYGDDFYADTIKNCRIYVYKEDQEMFLAAFRKEKIQQSLAEGKAFFLNYRLWVEGQPRYTCLKTIRSADGRIVLGVMDVDAQTRREMEENKEKLTYSNIAGALASRYEVIYYIDIHSNAYIQYSSSEGYAQLGTTREGPDFFSDVKVDVPVYIYKDDVELVLEALEKETLLESLEKTGFFTICYRQLLEGRIQYVTLYAVRPKGDSDHLIMAVANVDEIKQREKTLEKEVDSSREMATKDPLTNVKNKRAYVQAEMALDEKIAAGEKPGFAIVLCDINSLKQVNDHEGHQAGDEYIQYAAGGICHVFTHSPVFRVGGDEFLVLLTGEDYENRDGLMQELSIAQWENKLKKKATLAFGISEFDPDKDIRVQDVFERADHIMYENKRQFKSGVFIGEQKKAEKKGKEGREESISSRFSRLYLQMLSCIVSEEPDIAQIEDCICKMSAMFRLEKCVTRVYSNPREEQAGGGETLSCFDTGRPCVETIAMRRVTSVMSIVTTAVYMAPDQEPLSEEERWMVELVMRTTLSFVSRNRLRDLVYKLALFDERGFPNLRYLNQRIMEMAAKGDFAGKAAIHYNLRHFSLINQDLGRPTGDVVMQKHFDTLKALVGKGGFVTRLGGDNFVAVCYQKDLPQVTEFLTEAPIAYDDNGSVVTVSTSAGVFAVPDGYEIKEPGDLMGSIVTSLREAQIGGKDHIVFFNESLLVKKEKSMKVQGQFPEALRNREFVAYYQPKVDVKTGKLKGAEALCRWIRDGKMVPPCDFIPMLEETSDICRLDFYMLDRVCGDLRRWMDEGRPVVRTSVNLSRKHMMNANLLENITEIIDRHKVPHEYIEIELTETTTDVEFVDLKRVVNGLQQEGICTSVDDFGVGYSSLNLIREIPWNVLKVDKCFLPEDDDDVKSVRNIMFQSVVFMAGRLGLECVAEGVETKQQLKILAQTGCDLAQGYYFDRPLPPEEFVKRLGTGYYDKV